MTNGSGFMISARWGECCFRQTEMSVIIWNLSPLPRKNWENLEYKDYREFQDVSNEW
jgi:hypothetical protein